MEKNILDGYMRLIYDFLNQRRNTEEVVGGPCIDQDEINDVINHI